MNTNTKLFSQVLAFVNAEADLLDHYDYTQWLSIWSDTGLYIVPSDPLEEDYENALNIAYDNAEMRSQRVRRLESGEAVSTQLLLPTSRMISSVRILEESDESIRVRAAYCLYENKSGDIRHYPGTVDYVLRPHGDTFLLEKKVVSLLRASQYLATVAYIF